MNLKRKARRTRAARIRWSLERRRRAALNAADVATWFRVPRPTLKARPLVLRYERAARFAQLFRLSVLTKAEARELEGMEGGPRGS